MLKKEKKKKLKKEKKNASEHERNISRKTDLINSEGICSGKMKKLNEEKNYI